MANRRLKFLLIAQLALSAMIFVSCAESNVYNSSSLSDIALSTDVDKQLKPSNPTIAFTTDPPAVFCSFQNNKAPLGAKITAKWIYVVGDAKDLTNYVIDQWTELVKKQGRMAMFIKKLPGGWLKGNYKVVLSVNDIEEISIPFTIK
jgi:hypothetical protein